MKAMTRSPVLQGIISILRSSPRRVLQLCSTVILFYVIFTVLLVFHGQKIIHTDIRTSTKVKTHSLINTGMNSSRLFVNGSHIIMNHSTLSVKTGTSNNIHSSQQHNGTQTPFSANQQRMIIFQHHFTNNKQQFTNRPELSARGLKLSDMEVKMTLPNQKKSVVNQSQFHCITSLYNGQQKCKPVCPVGMFGLYGMVSCHPWLTCEEIKNITNLKSKTRVGGVKKVYTGMWNDMEVIVKKSKTIPVIEEYLNGLRLLKELSSETRPLQLLGECNGTLVTEAHPTDAERLHKQLRAYPQFNNIETRFRLCFEYVEIKSSLHSGRDDKIYIMCDNNSLKKLLGQYLLTEDFHLVLSDVDSLEEASVVYGQKPLIKCTTWGKIKNEFAAPEQIWRRKEKFDKNKLSKYDEKVDIWKIPDVCEYFIKGAEEAPSIRKSLSDIHRRCKSLTPSERPTAAEILHVYKQIMYNLQLANKNRN